MCKSRVIFAMLALSLSNSLVFCAINAPTSTAVCDEQLEKYRKFIADALLNIEDACEIFDTLGELGDKPISNREYFGGKYPSARNTISGGTSGGGLRRALNFYNDLSEQIGDVELSYVLKQIVGGRCHNEDFMTNKRDGSGVIIGKKQRFHSWGGKRSGNFLNGRDPTPTSYLPWYGQNSQF